MKEKFTILCVDDEEEILHSLKRSLMLEGYEVLTASSGAEGLKLLEKHKVDLVISDQRMPHMPGFEFLRIVRERYPQVMRIMLSGYSDFDGLVQTINEGEIFRFLSKPWNLAELRRIVQVSLEQNSLTHQIVATLRHFQESGGFMKDFVVEQSQEQNVIILKVSLNHRITSVKEIIDFFELLLDVLGVNKKDGLAVMMNAISKNKDKVIFTIDLGKGVALKIELPAVNIL